MGFFYLVFDRISNKSDHNFSNLSVAVSRGLDVPVTDLVIQCKLHNYPDSTQSVR